MTKLKYVTIIALVAVLGALSVTLSPVGGQDGGAEAPDDPNRGVGEAGPADETSGDSGLSDQDLAVANDQQFLDDVIIDGSACIGLDCVNGESFGFDTLRLKENNLRINFFDTSTSASFPSNDWRIVANDSSNGGGNYLAFEDSTAGRQPFRVEAGARANALYVEGDGDVGLGTNNPVVDLHVVTGNTPTLRLDQDGSSGFTAQTWDVAGNEANFFVRDATNGSALPFKIKPGAPTSSIFIEGTTGDIGLQEEAPDDALHIKRADKARIRFENTGDSAEWVMGVNNAGDMLITRVGGSQTSFIIRQDESIGIGNDPDGVAPFDFAIEIDANGNLTMNGTCTGTGC